MSQVICCGTLTRQGLTYLGQVVNGQPHGNGTGEGVIPGAPDGLLKYEGEWVDGFPEGNGKGVFTDGRRYEGIWSKGQPCDRDGRVYTSENNLMYSGGIKQSQFDGFGVRIYSNGEVYQGEWSGGLRHGQGSIKSSRNQSSFEGTWANDFREGQGTETTASGTVYTGSFHRDMWHGKGVLRTGDNFVYRGEFSHGKLSGNGILHSLKNNTVIRGYFSNGTPNGICRLTARGMEYLGSFSNGKQCGFGVLLRPGSVHVGYFQDGRPHGKGLRVVCPPDSIPFIQSGLNPSQFSAFIEAEKLSSYIGTNYLALCGEWNEGHITGSCSSLSCNPESPSVSIGRLINGQSQGVTRTVRYSELPQCGAIHQLTRDDILGSSTALSHALVVEGQTHSGNFMGPCRVTCGNLMLIGTAEIGTMSGSAILYSLDTGNIMRLLARGAFSSGPGNRHAVFTYDTALLNRLRMPNTPPHASAIIRLLDALGLDTRLSIVKYLTIDGDYDDFGPDGGVELHLYFEPVQELDTYTVATDLTISCNLSGEIRPPLSIRYCAACPLTMPLACLSPIHSVTYDKISSHSPLRGSGLIQFTSARYEGEITESMPHGHGTLYIDESSVTQTAVLECTWENGQIIGLESETELSLTRGDGANVSGRLILGENLTATGVGTIASSTPILECPEYMRSQYTYEGEIQANTAHGLGTLRTASGVQIRAAFQDGLPHGDDSRVTTKTWNYQGSLDCGIFHGSGKMDGYLQPGTEMPVTYEGEWRGGVPHGIGQATYSDNATDILHVSHEPGCVYQGRWDSGAKCGEGVQQWADGAEYNGSWKSGLRSGEGTLIEDPETGASYCGLWEDDLPHGTGLATGQFSLGAALSPLGHPAQLHGEWSHGTLIHGRLTLDSGALYVGSFSSGLRHGLGVTIEATGDIHIGHYSNGRLAGVGVAILPQLSVFVCGYFANSHTIASAISGVSIVERVVALPTQAEITAAMETEDPVSALLDVARGCTAFTMAHIPMIRQLCALEASVSSGESLLPDTLIALQFLGVESMSQADALDEENDLRTTLQQLLPVCASMGFDFSSSQVPQLGDPILTIAQCMNGAQRGRGVQLCSGGLVAGAVFNADEITGQDGLLYISSSQFLYTGTLKDGQPSGKGHAIWEDGTEFDGSWRGEPIEGRLTTTTETYQGSLGPDLMRSGKGTLSVQWEGRDISFSGTFTDNILSGPVMVTVNDISSMRADVEDGVFVGHGQITATDGNLLATVTFSSVISHPLVSIDGVTSTRTPLSSTQHGSVAYTDGGSYTGYLLWGQLRHGSGEAVAPDGTVWTGEWRGDAPVNARVVSVSTPTQTPRSAATTSPSRSPTLRSNGPPSPMLSGVVPPPSLAGTMTPTGSPSRRLASTLTLSQLLTPSIAASSVPIIGPSLVLSPASLDWLKSQFDLDVTALGFPSAVSVLSVEGSFGTDGRLTGQCRIEYADALYLGEVSGALRSGRGTLQLGEGGVVSMDGVWENDSLVSGTIRSPECSWSGSFDGFLPNGKVEVIWINGNRYTGSIRNGLFDGNGKLIRDGFIYEGCFSNGLFSGRGELIAADGTKSTGEWAEGQLHGQAVVLTPDGVEFTGTFDHGARKGWGTEKHRDGTTIVGQWG